MGRWAMVVAAERYAQERLVAHDAVELTGAGPAPGDEVALVAAADPPLVFGLGRVTPETTVAYTHRLLDEPVVAASLAFAVPGAHPLDEAAWQAVTSGITADHRVDADKRTWLVSVDLPIEAPSPAEAVRIFWSYVQELGPRELPAFVSPSGDELAMQAFVLGEPANQDPEEDDD
jgi:hypothetical protein